MKTTRPSPPPPPRSVRKKILVVDDHPMTRLGVTERLRIEPDLAVCADVGSAKEALAAVEKLAPDLVLVDLSMGERSGLELIKDLHALHPHVPVLVFSMHYETLYAERALRAGARGYVMKSEGAEKLISAVRAVLSGNVYLSPVMRDRAVHRFARGPAAVKGDNAAVLSDRELEVFELIGQGLGTRQISERLKLSTSTVETHRSHIKEKLNLGSATELVRAAVEWTAGRGH
jgi:DNA-binding NarL/FixJ family response regulator